MISPRFAIETRPIAGIMMEMEGKVVATISREFEAPEREAAFFYGLFLRGFTYQELRQDIEVPDAVLAQWQRTGARDPDFASMTGQVLAYRRRVLAIFKSLVSASGTRVQ